jgi:asparagine synthase (glutamine-hydrolysing)
VFYLMRSSMGSPPPSLEEEQSMSIQFGRWNCEAQPPAPDYIEKVSATLAPYGPDSSESYNQGGIQILYRAFHTTKESHCETQPFITTSGAVITWDGRLDNRTELIYKLRNCLTNESTDVAIVAAAYEKWGAKCFAKLIGDWALSIWNPTDRSLLLVKDPVGTRHLFYSTEKSEITWCSILDPLVLFASKAFALNEEYIAGWFVGYPPAHLTPYVGIHAVPPSSSVLLRPGKHTVMKYWDFDSTKNIRYRSDAQYEEHFRTVFANAVQRMLRSDRPVLAELSGGMDSSSIVCMADIVSARGQADCPRLDTLSWFDNTYDHIEPDSNELHWIAKVEEKRGRSGHHINISELESEYTPQKRFQSEFDNDSFAAIPLSNTGIPEHFKPYAAYMRSHGHRVVLSGIGGGEVAGDGVPTPKPELQNLMVRARFITLGRQLNAWAAKMRKPRLPLLWEAARGFFPIVIAGEPENKHLAPWFSPRFLQLIHSTIRSHCPRVKLFGPLPSFQNSVRGLNGDRRVMAYFGPRPEMLRELRYPYLDRDLLEFMYAIPREQIVRVGQRRSLMKRALVGIVPDQLLNRKRKAFVPLPPPTDASAEWASLHEIGQRFVCTSIGIMDTARCLEALRRAARKEEVPVDSLKRTLTLEFWLRHLMARGVLTNPTPMNRRGFAQTLGPKDSGRAFGQTSSASS